MSKRDATETQSRHALTVKVKVKVQGVRQFATKPHRYGNSELTSHVGSHSVTLPHGTGDIYLFIYVFLKEPSHRVCKPAYLVPVPSQDKLGGLCQEAHPA